LGKKVLGIFEPKRQEVIEDGGNFMRKGFIIFVLHLIGREIKSSKMILGHVARMQKRNTYKSIVGKSDRNRPFC
jgi:hypothetical protein